MLWIFHCYLICYLIRYAILPWILHCFVQLHWNFHCYKLLWIFSVFLCYGFFRNIDQCSSAHAHLFYDFLALCSSDFSCLCSFFSTMFLCYASWCIIAVHFSVAIQLIFHLLCSSFFCEIAMCTIAIFISIAVHLLFMDKTYRTHYG